MVSGGPERLRCADDHESSCFFFYVVASRLLLGCVWFAELCFSREADGAPSGSRRPLSSCKKEGMKGGGVKPDDAETQKEDGTTLFTGVFVRRQTDG